jgi:hypothetical protein
MANGFKLAALALIGWGLAVTGAVAAPALQHVDDFQLSDQNFIGRRLYKMADAKAVVLVAYAASDARFRSDAPTLGALKAAYGAKGVEFLIVDSRLGDTRGKLAADPAVANLEIPVLFDYEQLVGEGLGLTRTAEALVVNPRTWIVVFRGPVGSPAVRRALDALVGGQPVTPSASRRRAGSSPTPAGPDRNLLRPGRGADRPGQVRRLPPARRPRADAVHQLRPDQGLRRDDPRGAAHPPHAAVPAGRHGRPLGAERGLSSDQLKTMVHWIEAGAPRGAGDDPLAKASFQAPPWKLGQPDLVLALPPVDVPPPASCPTRTRSSPRTCRRVAGSGPASSRSPIRRCCTTSPPR